MKRFDAGGFILGVMASILLALGAIVLGWGSFFLGGLGVAHETPLLIVIAGFLLAFSLSVVAAAMYIVWVIVSDLRA